MNYFVSLETGIWVERKKSPLFKKKYISKKQAELNELRANCALKIITFRDFAFFLELPFYFLLFIHFISFLCMTFSGTHMLTVRTGSYAPATSCILFRNLLVWLDSFDQK